MTDRWQDPEGEPTKPNLNIVRVNLDGTLYTWKLAVYYFRKQPDTEDRDRCFIITGSMVAWIDSPVGSGSTVQNNRHFTLTYDRATGNIRARNMHSVASCGQSAAPASSKASE